MVRVEIRQGGDATGELVAEQEPEGADGDQPSPRAAGRAATEFDIPTGAASPVASATRSRRRGASSLATLNFDAPNSPPIG